MDAGDTIVACATGFASGPRALVRVSGPGVAELLDACFEPGLVPPAATISRAVFRLGGQPLACLIMRFAEPRSYTSEDSLEILVPGNRVLVERVIGELTARPGVRLATPGEFSARAYLHGKLTLAQAEGVAATIAARSDEELAAARRLLEGVTGLDYRSWSDGLATILALVEAGIDFTDQEDVVPIAPARLARRLRELRGAIAEHLGGESGAEASALLPTVALAGPPNAGKSTLFNALLGARRAVVSDVAGTTRDVLSERLQLDDLHAGSAVMLQDLAGLDAREGLGAPDRAGQAQAMSALERADVVVLCDPAGRFDVRVPGDAGRPTIRVRTKADLPGASVSAGVVPVCAVDGYNLGALRRAIGDAARRGRGVLPPRHRWALERAARELRRAEAHVEAGCPFLEYPELVADALRSALDALGELTGEVTPDDVIGRVFATFCVGK